MKTKTTSLLGAAIATIALTLAPANAVGVAATASSLDTGAVTETYGGCSSGRYGYRGSYYRGGHSSYDRGYSRNRHVARYTDRCRVIGRSYFHRGCYRYCRITYRHERIDCYGRVIRCWTSCKTVRV